MIPTFHPFELHAAQEKAHALCALLDEALRVLKEDDLSQAEYLIVQAAQKNRELRAKIFDAHEQVSKKVKA